MKNSNQSLKNSSLKILNWLVFGFLILGFIGFIDASYLTAKYFLGSPLPCVIFTGCETVTTSVYSTILGIPVALLGTFYYAAIFLFSVLYLDIRKRWILLALSGLTLIGFAASVYFVYLQLFIIRAICLYCIISAVDSTLLLILGIAMTAYLKKQFNEQSNSENNSQDKGDAMQEL